jgi:hypothetical protein
MVSYKSKKTEAGSVNKAKVVKTSESGAVLQTEYFKTKGQAKEHARRMGKTE